MVEARETYYTNGSRDLTVVSATTSHEGSTSIAGITNCNLSVTNVTVKNHNFTIVSVSFDLVNVIFTSGLSIVSS